MFTLPRRHAVGRCCRTILAHPTDRNFAIRRITSTAKTCADSDAPTATPPIAVETNEAWVFIDSIFPITLGAWDFRRFVVKLQEENLLNGLKDVLNSIKIHQFKVLSVESKAKDGGVFVHFQYVNPRPLLGEASSSTPANPLAEIEKAMREEAAKHGGIPTWSGMYKGRLWLVRGEPWLEDMHRFVSPLVKVEFEGPDVHQEVLYETIRPYGRIIDITRPTPVPAGSLRSSTVSFRSLRAASAAQNCLHGIWLPNIAGDGKLTRLAVLYENPIKAHAVRDWITSHPKIVIPILAFLLGTLTYTIFDPVRIFAVEGKVMGWFDLRKNTVVQWVRRNTIDKLSFRGSSAGDNAQETGEVWRERKEAESALRSYLSEYPSTIAVVHGPQGSGKWSMVSQTLEQQKRKTLEIDCAEIYKANSDAGLVAELAKQTGYWPVFSFLNSINNLIDLASMGLIGQKAGFSTSIEAQLKQILEVVGTALERVNSEHATEKKREEERQEIDRQRDIASKERSEKIRLDLYHDGRIDCVAGNGVMSELGFGIEPMKDWEADSSTPGPSFESSESSNGNGTGSRPREREGSRRVDDIGGLPIVVVRNYGLKGAKREDLLEVLAEWAATLVDNQIAHVIVISDNRDNMKRLAKALPASPLAAVALTDADPDTALALVESRLKEAGVETPLSSPQIQDVQRLGGRASDLEALTYKVKNGQKVEEAVEDIIVRSLAELKKTAFGDDNDDAKNLPWSREQAWSVLKQLSQKDEIQYADVLLDFPFKGDEAALRAMEHAELISITAHDSQADTIIPGKPVYKYVFQRLVRDPIFQAVQDIAFNEKAIAANDSVVRSCEAELVTLKEIGIEQYNSVLFGRGATAARADYLFAKMKDAMQKIEKLEKANAQLKLVLARGGSSPN